MTKPMHAVEWIKQEGNRLRKIGAGDLRKALKREKRTCTWCGKSVPKGRQTWCSKDCVSEFKLRCQPNVAAQFVYERDQGMCRECYRSVEPMVRLVELLRHLPFPVRSEIRKVLRASGYIDGGSGRPWHMDHIVPVSEGGGLCGPGGLRLLCIHCHKVVTAKWRKEKSTRGSK